MKLALIKIRVLSLLFLCAFPFSGLRAEEGKGEKVVDLVALKKQAEKGGVKEQLNYGKALQEKSQREEAGIWIQKAADQGSAEAWYWLGYASLGKGHENTYYFEKAAELGHPEALGKLIEIFLFRAANEADIVKAKKYADLARKFGVRVGYDSAESLRAVDRCFEMGEPKIPVKDLPSNNEEESYLKSLKETPCVVYLEGLGVSKDLEKYRKCLLSGEEKTRDNNKLAEIYANGWSVKRNARLAMALICHGSEVPAELFSMLDSLYDSKDLDKASTLFLFCNHATSGMDTELCSADEAYVEEKKRAVTLQEVTKNWTPIQKKLFDSLWKAATNFFAKHSTSEQDMSGSTHASFSIGEKMELTKEFLTSIKNFEAGQIPESDDFKQADLDLNKVYSKLLKLPKDETGLDKDKIRSTQKLWLVFRDALAAFGPARYPKTSAETWKAWLTRLRVKQIKEMVIP